MQAADPSHTAAVIGARSAAQIQSVARALTIVELLAEAGRSLPLSVLSQRAGLKPSTCHHLLGTLVARGWVRHDMCTRNYMLGDRIAELHERAADPKALPALAQAAVQALGVASGEAVHLATMQGYELVTLLKVECTHAVRVDTGAVGKSWAAHATATGKALLADWPRERLDQLVTRIGLRRFTERTITDPARLHDHLARVRRAGHAEDVEEFQPGVHCIGAPVHSPCGDVVAAVSCSMPTMRSNRASVARIRELVRHCAHDVSMRLGHCVPALPSP